MTGEDISQAHAEALLEGARLGSTMLLVQATMTLRYTGLEAGAQDLRLLQERSSSTRG